MKFIIQIEEQLSRSIEIEANSEYEAISIIKKAYQAEDIVLDENDFVQVDFKMIK
ncbi:MAG: DpnD/PcfM family protein [Methylobacter sp.]